MSSAVVADLGPAVLGCSVPLVAIQFIPAPITNGKMVAKPEEKRIDFEGSFQPITNKTMERPPEGSLNTGRAKIYTPFELKTTETSATTIADRVVYKGVTYQVDKVEDWFDLGGFFKVEVVRMGQ